MANNGQPHGTAASAEPDPAAEVAFYESLSPRDQRIFQAYRANGFQAAIEALGFPWEEDRNGSLYLPSNGAQNRGGGDQGQKLEIPDSEAEDDNNDETQERNGTERNPPRATTFGADFAMLEADPYFEQGLLNLLTHNGCDIFHANRGAGLEATCNALLIRWVDDGNGGLRPDMRNPFFSQYFADDNPEPNYQEGGGAEGATPRRPYSPTRPGSDVENSDFGAAQRPYTPSFVATMQSLVVPMAFHWGQLGLAMAS